MKNLEKEFSWIVRDKNKYFVDCNKLVIITPGWKLVMWESDM